MEIKQKEEVIILFINNLSTWDIVTGSICCCIQNSYNIDITRLPSQNQNIQNLIFQRLKRI